MPYIQIYFVPNSIKVSSVVQKKNLIYYTISFLIFLQAVNIFTGINATEVSIIWI